MFIIFTHASAESSALGAGQGFEPGTARIAVLSLTQQIPEVQNKNTMERLDQGHLNPRDWNVSPRYRTRASTVGGEHFIKELFEQCINSTGYLAFRNIYIWARDNTYFINVQPSYGGSRRELGKLEFPPGESPTVSHLAIYCGNSLADCTAPLPPPSHVPALLCRAVDVVRWAQLQKRANKILAVYSVHCAVADPDFPVNADWYKQCCGPGSASGSESVGSVCFLTSGSVSHKYGSGSFHHQAQIVRKPGFILFCHSLMTFTSVPDPYVFLASRVRIRIRYTEVRIRSESGTKMSRIHIPQHWYKDGKTDSQNLSWQLWRYVGNSSNEQFIHLIFMLICKLPL